MRVLKHSICFISLFNPFSHVMMSDGNYGLTSGHYTDCNSLLSYPYMAILLSYMVGGGGGEGSTEPYTRKCTSCLRFYFRRPLGQAIISCVVSHLNLTDRSCRGTIRIDMGGC